MRNLPILGTVSKGKQLVKYINGGDDFISMKFSLEYKLDILYELYAAKEKIPFEEVVSVSHLITEPVEGIPLLVDVAGLH